MADNENTYTFQLLTINSVDFTAYINQRSYSVQKDDEYARWTDGNWKVHRDIARTRITGKFNMTFTSETDFNSFTSAISAVKTNGGYCPIQIYVNTTKTVESINAFLDFSAKHVWTTEAFGQTPNVAGVTVKVTQR